MNDKDSLASLRAALEMHALALGDADILAEHLAAAIKSAVRDSLPGRQQKRNLDPIMAKAMRAAVRTLRRRAKT